MDAKSMEKFDENQESTLSSSASYRQFISCKGENLEIVQKADDTLVE